MTSTAIIQTQNSGGQASEYMVTYAPALEGSTATLTITRLSGEYTDVVNWSTQLAFGPNAAAADDFVATSSSFNLTKNESTTIRIQTLSDTRLEAAEFFYINFYDAEGKQYTNQLKLQISQYITDGPTNVAPDAVNDSIQTSEDTPAIISVLANDTDANRDALSITGTTQPANGQVAVNANGTITYTPYANYNGTDQFTYTASDNKGGTDTATVLVTVNPVNDAPTGTATAVLAAGTEDTAYTVSAATLLQGFSDVDGNILSVTGLSASNGTVTNNNSTYTVTPTPNYNGLVTLTYTVSDSQGGTAPGQRTFTLAAINDAPTAAAAAESNAGTEDTAISGTLLAGSDIDSPSLTFVKGSSVVGGTVDIDAATGEYTFTPAPNFNGQASFTYAVSDGALSSAEKTVTINVASVNDAPKGAPVAIFLPNGTEDIAFTVAAADLLAGFSDVDGDILSVSGLSADHGTITNNNDGTYTVTPNANYHGTLKLTYQVIDGQGGSVSGQQTFTLAAVNDTPEGTATASLVGGTEDTSYTVSAADLLEGFSDVDDDELNVADLTASHGSVTNNGDGTFTIAPTANYNGVVQLSYNVVDGHNGSVAGSRNFTLAAANDAPTGAATAVLLNGTEDTSYTVSASELLAGFSDVDDDELNVASLAADHGSVVDNGNGTYTITPTGNYNGLIILSYDVIDGQGGLVSSQQTFTLAAVNDAPAAAEGEETNSTDEDTPVTGTLLAGSDIDSATLTFLEGSAVVGGTVEINPTTGEYTFTPAANFNGETSFTYVVSDGSLTSAEKTVTIQVAPINDAPTGAATASLAGGSEDTPYIVSADDLLAGFRDVDGDTLDITDLAASHGSVTDNGNGTYTIAPTANYNGVVQLTYNVVDGNNGSVAGSRNFSLAAVNDGPAGAATAVLLDGTEDTSYIVSADDLLQGFSDVDGDELDVANLAADHGSVLDNGDGTYTLTPDADYNGVVTLSFDAVDGNGGSVSGQQTFSLAATNDLAVLTAPATATFNENVAGPVTVATLSATDVDNADGAFTGEFRIVGGADAGLFTISNNELRYNGSALDFETASKKSFQVQVSAFDGVGDSNMQTVTVSLQNVVERIFTASNDTFDFNANPGGFDRDGQQYDALAGNDIVHLPNMGVVTDWDYGRTFNAGAGDDQIFGGTGSDIVDGGLGHDHLAGGAGSDKLFGKAGDDRLVGGEGNDFLVGGAGADKYTGSSGKDVFIFNSAEEVGKLSGPHDVITDFTQREDLIDLSGIYAGKTVARVVNSSSIKAYEIGYYTQSGKTYVIGDVDGNGTTDFGLELTGAYKLTSSDFILKDSADFLNKVAGADLSLYNFLHI